MNQLTNEELAKLTEEINEVLAKYDAEMSVLSQIQITKRNGTDEESNSNHKTEESSESSGGEPSK